MEAAEVKTSEKTSLSFGTFTHILRSALCHKSYLTLHRLGIHSARENLELSRTALLCRHLLVGN